MRVIRGAGPRGMGGIPYVRPVADAPGIRVIRPLLDCSRREIVNFLRQRGLRSRLDSTNLSRKYLRNRLRRLALPEMKREWGERLTADLCSLAALAQRFQARSDAIREALQSQNSVPRDERVCRDGVRLAAPHAAGDAARPGPDLDERGRPVAEDAFGRGVRENRRAPRLAGADASRSPAPRWPASGGDYSSSARRPPPRLTAATGSAEAEYRVQLDVPGRTRIEPLGGGIEAEILTAGKELIARKRATRDGFEEFLDLEKVELPLVARFPRPGDRMRPLGAPGSRKLQDIFTDLHVPPWLRTRTLLVTVEDRPDLDRRPPHRRRREAHRPNAQSLAAEISAERLNLFISRGRCAVDSRLRGNDQ